MTPPDGDATQFVPATVTPSFSYPDNWQIGDCIDNRYLLEEKFSGAMGHVFIAQHLGWGVKMAIKVPRPEVNANKEGVQRIINEAKGWINLGVHPNIASCYFVRRQEHSALIFIEYVNGGTLSEWITKKRCQDLRVALTIAIQFCNGMEYTHSKKIIHRDIKPHNILLTKDGLVKITDFGIIRYADNTTFLPDATVSLDLSNDEETIGFRGTPNYASPEQLRNTHQVDKRTDIYSFGICLWMMFCGQRPYKHNSETECPQPSSVQSKTPLTRDLSDILRKCVQHDPDKRHQNFAELRQELHDVYLDNFTVSCPFAQLGPVNLEAEHLNNRAVSLAELGKYKQAKKFLQRALELDDNLQEALINMHLLSWRATKIPPSQMQRRLQATQKRFPDSHIFNELRDEVKDNLNTDSSKQKKIRHRRPDLLLSPPRAPMELFRKNQLRRSIRNNIRTLAKQKKYKRCYTTLHSYWQENGYQHDLGMEKIYDHLVNHSHKKAIRALQRREICHLPDPAAFVHYNPTTARLACATQAGYFRLVTLAKPCKLAGKSLTEKSQQQSFVLRSAQVSAITICPSGSFMAIGLADGRILLRSLLEKKSKTIPLGSAITTLLFSVDNRWLAAATAGKIIFYDLVKGDKQEFATGATASAMTLLPNSLNFIAGCADGSLQLWDFSTKKMTRAIDAHVLPITAIALNQEGNKAATTGEDRMIRIWDMASGNCLQTIEDDEDMVNSILFGNDGFSLITGSNTDLIKTWDLTSGKNILLLDGRGDGFTQLIEGPNATSFISSSRNGSVVLWKIIYDLNFDS